MLNKCFLLGRIFQSTLPVWGATGWPLGRGWSQPISIHAPRVGSDSTPRTRMDIRSISIHAPRVGSDDPHRYWHVGILHFNPRSPCGERQLKGDTLVEG